MKQNIRLITLTAVVLALVLAAGTALAGHRDRDGERRLTVIDDDGQRYEIVIDDREGIEVVDEDGEIVADLDFEDLEEAIDHIVGRAMVGVGHALQALSKMDLDIRWNADDSQVFLALDDKMMDFEIDIDEIMDDVGEALESIDDFDFDIDFDKSDRYDRRHGRHRERYVIQADDEADELRDEMDRLREEISQLKKELARAQRPRRH